MSFLGNLIFSAYANDRSKKQRRKAERQLEQDRIQNELESNRRLVHQKAGGYVDAIARLNPLVAARKRKDDGYMDSLESIFAERFNVNLNPEIANNSKNTGLQSETIHTPVPENSDGSITPEVPGVIHTVGV